MNEEIKSEEAKALAIKMLRIGLAIHSTNICIRQLRSAIEADDAESKRQYLIDVARYSELCNAQVNEALGSVMALLNGGEESPVQ